MTSLISNKTVQFVQEVFFPNESVTGFIEFNLRDPADISAITVNIVGERNIIKTNASRGNGTSNEESGTNSAGVAVRILKLMDVTESIFSASPGQKKEAGFHSVPFSVKLPPNIPSSIESPKWSVYYKLIATVVWPSNRRENFEKCFSVNRVCDLNTYPNLKVPAEMQCSGRTNLLCMNWNTVDVFLNVDRSGFVPGEQIFINARVENNSSRSISYTKISIVQKIRHVDMFLDMRKLKFKRTVVDSTRGAIPVGGTQIWQDELLTIPPIPPSSVHDCFGWSVNYYLQMDAVNVAMKKKVTLRLPIIVGNIPFKDLYPHLKISRPEDSKLEFFQIHKDYFSEEECVFSNKTGDDLEIQSTPKYLTLRTIDKEDFPRERICSQTENIF